MLTRIEGIKYLVDVSSAKAHREHPEAWAMASFHRFIKNGGFSAVYLPSVHKEPVICALTDIMAVLTAKETLAMLLHEEAHIVNGDLDHEVLRDAPPGSVLSDQEAELKADLYAAERVGAYAVYSALNKTLRKQAVLLCEEFGLTPEEQWSCVADTLEITERFEALQKLIDSGGKHDVPLEIWSAEKVTEILNYLKSTKTVAHNSV